MIWYVVCRNVHYYVFKVLSFKLLNMTKITNHILLECIKEQKDVFFGTFSSQLTHQDREKTWKKF